MQGEVDLQQDGRGGAGGGRGGRPPDGSPPHSWCTSSSPGDGDGDGDGMLVDDSPNKSSVTCKSAPSLGSRTSGDGKTRRYIRSSEPRLKWSDELHECFLSATAQLGGPEKATPKSILQAMNTRGLKIAHVKSHLQMYRNPKSGKCYSPPSDQERGAHFDPQPRDLGYWNYSPQDRLCAVSHDVDPQIEGSWRSSSARTEMPPPNITTTASMISSVGSESCSSCPLESSLQFNHMSQFSNMHALLSSEPRPDELYSRAADHVRPENIYKMVEILDYDYAELQEHNLLMAINERRLLETGFMPDHESDLMQSHARDDNHGANIPEVPLDLTMSVGAPASALDVRPEILTLDLTGQLNRPH